MGIGQILESLLPNYLSTFLPSGDTTATLIVFWGFAIFFFGRWWFRKFGQRWRSVIWPTVSGAIILIGLFVGSVSAARYLFPREGSDLDVARFEAKQPSIGQQFKANVYLINRGSLKAHGLQIAGGLGFTSRSLDEDFINDKFQHAYALLAKDPEIIGNEIQPGSSNAMFTEDGGIFDKDMIDAFGARTGTLYLILVLRHKDSAVPRGQWRYTEICGWFQSNGLFQLCPNGRNRTYTGP